MSSTFTKSVSFTIVHARHLASKVAADMHLCARYYGEPSEERIRAFAEELAQFLNRGYVVSYEFGFKNNERRVVTWQYTVDANGLVTSDDRAGKVDPSVNVTGAAFFTFLTWTSDFAALSPEERLRFTADLPVQRTVGEPPADGEGLWVSDRNYYSGGVGLGRRTFKPR